MEMPIRICLIICNLALALMAVGAVGYCYRKDGSGKVVFRYFTVLSNLLCAAAALVMAAAECAGKISAAVLILKYVGTVAVSVTCLTVFAFLIPVLRVNLLKGPDFFLHLICPVLALLTFCGFENQGGIPLAAVIAGVLPVVLYGILYFYRVLLCPEEERWDDFYAFNRDGRWPVSLLAMLFVTIALAFVIRAL